MNRDQAIGWAIFFASIIVAIIYGWLIFTPSIATIVIQITIFVAVAALLGILAWIGYTMATTPAPTELEVEEEQSGS
ncbi:MAG: transcriptional regulator [Thaumarchaeota archaeon]|nr:transcriptional regulator [Nitrososphaerota archaeon]